MATSTHTEARPLRVALLWNGELLDERLLQTPAPVLLGTGKHAMFPLPEGAIKEQNALLLTPAAGGYSLQPVTGMDGVLWLSGKRLSARGLREPLALGEGDYGLLSFGSATVFFQTVQRVRGAVPRRAYRDGALIACVGLSIFSHVVTLLFLFLVAAEELAPVSALELDSALLTKMMVEPPPEDPSVLARKKREDGQVDPGQRERDEAGGKRAPKDEGRLGKRDAAETRTEVAGAEGGAVAAQVRGLGLLGALSGGKGDAMARALDMPSLDNLLSGMGSAQTVIGQGSGGLSLRGAGSGGGGTSTGVAYGAGELGTAVAGGKGLGRGAQGLGPKGRETHEVSLSLDSAAARVSGFLSREQINRVVQANRAAIKYCFESALQQKPKLQGAVHVQWRIDRQGNVSTTRIEKSTLDDAKVEGCIVRQIKRWKFPLPDGGEVDVVYPFIFRGQ